MRGLGRVAVGLLVAVAGGVLAGRACGPSPAALDAAAAQEFPGRATVAADGSAAGRCVAVLAGVLGIAAGLLAVLRGRDWPAMGRRYERGDAPAAAAARRPETDEDRAQAAWKALDRGEDPTTDPAPAGASPL